MKKHLKIVIYIISAVLISCNNSKPNLEKVTQVNKGDNFIEISKAQFQNSKMELGECSLETFSNSIKTNGFIDVPPANKASISAVMGGFIKQSNLLEGDGVKKGQLVLTIENPEFIEIQQEYLEVYEQLKFLENEFKRQKTLYNEKITSEKSFLKAESNYKTSRAIYNGLSEKLRLMRISKANVENGKFTSVIAVYAPISGVISKVNTSVGKFMNASDILLEIIDDSHKHLELVVFEKDVLNVKKGQKIHFKTPENSSRYYEGNVHLIGKFIDEETRTVRVHGHLEDEKEPFIVGMFVEAEIITDSFQKNALPIEAVLEEDGNYFVLELVEKNEDYFKFNKKTVSVGEKSEQWIELLDFETTLKDKEVLVKGTFIPLEE